MKWNQQLGLLKCALIATTVACGVESSREPPRRPGEGQLEADDGDGTGRAKTPLLMHVIPPHDTDSAIDQAVDDHLTWLDRSAPSNHQLLVFMPGHAAAPALYQLVQEEAAELGYHVIGLAYVNGGEKLAVKCVVAPDPNACWEDTHLQNLDGIPRPNSVVDVRRANSIYNRLSKLLEHLSTRYPEEGWAQFLEHHEPKWRRMAVGGHSQGGAQGAMIAKLHVVGRVVLFSSTPDADHGGAPEWLAAHATPAARYWGLTHDRDPGFRPIRGSWALLGMDAFGVAVSPETSAPPYARTHILVTDLAPQGGSDFHGSTVMDNSTPRAPEGTLLLRDAWRHVLGGGMADQDHDE